MLGGALADAGPIEIPQDDIFFRCNSGRLKLRPSKAGIIGANQLMENLGIEPGQLIEEAYIDLLARCSDA